MTAAQRNRKYDSQLRAEQAAATRARIVAAARAVFLRRGYAASSIVAIAHEAHVSRETVYQAYGTKANLLKAVYDAAVVGDTDPVAVAERPAYREMLADPDPHSLLRTFGRLSAELVTRIGPVLLLIHEGGLDPDIARLTATMRQERLASVRQLLTHLQGVAGRPLDADLDRAVDTVWALISPELTLLLIEQRGWSAEEYGTWLGHTISALVLGRDP
jgi:AcrR family transcriptional regulator